MQFYIDLPDAEIMRIKQMMSNLENVWINIKDQQPPNDPYNREYWVYETLNNRVQHDYWVCPNKELGQDFEPFFQQLVW